MAQGNVATPFLEMPSFVSEETDSFVAEAPPRAIGSPFISVYELDGRASTPIPSARPTRRSCRTCTTRNSTRRSTS